MKKYIYLFVILTIGFSSFETEEPIPTYTLSTTVSPTEGGKITVSPQSSNYKEGDVVTLTPEPNEHWVFQKWDGDGSGSSTPLQITMTSDKSVVGVFVKRDYPLTLTIEGEGTVEEKIVTNPGGREYPHGTTVQLTPKPKEGWVFESWGGDLSGTESPKNITVDKEKKVTVKFKRRDYPLTLTIEGEGTVEEKIVTNPGGREYPFQTVVELTPVPKEGWVFESWGGDLSGTESPKNITVDKEKKVTVKFKEVPKFFLHENGITCLCPDTKPGDKGIVNGVEYESVDNDLLRKRRDEKKDLSKFCTSLVTGMSNLFEKSDFNQPIGNWDVSNVTNMGSMFRSSQFNQPIGNWDVGKVTSMGGMFSGSPFNQPIGNWDVGKVTSMGSMFAISPFNQPIGDWNVSNVVYMGNMFSESPFNQPIGNWDVGKVRSMVVMFSLSPFNQPIGNWDVGNVTNMGSMFSGSPFNQPIGNWDVSNVTSMSRMFRSSQFNQPIGDWNVSNVVYMGNMFSESPFNQPIGNWDVGKVTMLSDMFFQSPFNQPIGNWDVSNVTSMSRMFSVSPFNQNISKWCVTYFNSEPELFSGGSLTPVNKPKWGTCPD